MRKPNLSGALNKYYPLLPYVSAPIVPFIAPNCSSLTIWMLCYLLPSPRGAQWPSHSVIGTSCVWWYKEQTLKSDGAEFVCIWHLNSISLSNTLISVHPDVLVVSILYWLFLWKKKTEFSFTPSTSTRSWTLLISLYCWLHHSHCWRDCQFFSQLSMGYTILLFPCTNFYFFLLLVIVFILIFVVWLKIKNNQIPFYFINHLNFLLRY